MSRTPPRFTLSGREALDAPLSAPHGIIWRSPFPGPPRLEKGVHEETRLVLGSIFLIVEYLRSIQVPIERGSGRHMKV